MPHWLLGHFHPKQTCPPSDSCKALCECPAWKQAVGWKRLWYRWTSFYSGCAILLTPSLMLPWLLLGTTFSLRHVSQSLKSTSEKYHQGPWFWNLICPELYFRVPLFSCEQTSRCWGNLHPGTALSTTLAATSAQSSPSSSPQLKTEMSTISNELFKRSFLDIGMPVFWNYSFPRIHTRSKQWVIEVCVCMCPYTHTCIVKTFCFETAVRHIWQHIN